MKNENYSCSYNVHATPEKIFNSIYNVQGWWAADVKGSTNKFNDVFTVRFGKTYSNFKIVEFISCKKMVWLVTDSYLPLFKNQSEWLHSKIVWEIEAYDDSSKLIMTHAGLTPACECFVDCNKGWNFYVGESLKKLITANKGMPGTGIFTHISNSRKRYDGLLYLKTDALPVLNAEHLIADVKEMKGEHVTSVYSIQKLNPQNFNTANLKGEYYVLIENKPLYGTQPIEDIQQILN